MNETFDQYRDRMARKTVKQLEREIASWRSYMQKHSKAYAWHGAGMTPPGELSDGDRLMATRDALEIAMARRGAA